jgi:hypothetical protein
MREKEMLIRSLFALAGVSFVAPTNTSSIVARMYAIQDACRVVSSATSSNTTGNSTTITAPTLSLLDPAIGVTFLAIEGNTTVGAFAGETGGDWTEAIAEFATGFGNGLTIQLQTTGQLTPGTGISGGTIATVATEWIAHGFLAYNESAPTEDLVLHSAAVEISGVAGRHRVGQNRRP